MQLFSRSSAVLLSAHPGYPPWQVYLFGLTLGLVTGMDFIASGMPAMAASHIQGGIGATPNEFLWVLTSFACGTVIANLLIGQLARRIGYRRYTRFALWLFMLATLACSVAPDIRYLALARLLQGLAAGGLFTASRVLIQLVALPRERKPLMYGFLLGCFGFGALIPWLSAMVVEQAGWQGVFGVQALLALPVWLLMEQCYPPHDGQPAAGQQGKLDGWAVLAFGLGMLLLLHAGDDVQLLRPSANPVALAGGVLGLALLGWTGWRLWHHVDPWLDLRSLVRRRYLTGLAFYMLYYLCNGGWNYVLPVLLENGLGFNFITTGRVMSLSSSVTVLVAMGYLYFSQYIARRRGYIVLGFGLLMVSCLWTAQSLMSGLSVDALLPPLLLHGLVPVLAVVQVASMTYLELEPGDFAHAYQLKNILRELARTVGTGLACLQLQNSQAAARTVLIERLTPYQLATANQPLTPEWLAQLSDSVNQQATLLAGQHLLLVMAGVAALAMLAVMLQRHLV